MMASIAQRTLFFHQPYLPPHFSRFHSIPPPTHERSFLSRSVNRASHSICLKAASAVASGWDDLPLSNTGYSSRGVLLSDTRHLLIFSLGLITAFAISRVRISSIVLFPASVLIFAVGFSFGFFRSGCLSAVPTKRDAKIEIPPDYRHKFRKALEVLDALDDHADKIPGIIDYRGTGLRELEEHLKMIESINVPVAEAKECLNNIINSFPNSKAVDGSRFNPVQFVSGVFEGASGNPNADEIKNKRNYDQPKSENETDYQKRDEPYGKHIKYRFADRITARYTRCEEFTFQNDGFVFGDLNKASFKQPSAFVAAKDESDEVMASSPEFDHCLREANHLLKQAKMNIRDKDRAEIFLCQSAELFSKAVSINPRSLTAIGQLGNTYLLHGELKLRIARELRSVITKNQSASRGNAVLSLVEVCEECEELLVEAGMKYKLALSIDRDDARALYNWGLALSFRAQLIADVGPESAFDADELFLAAIDKFDAMMTKSNMHAPDALYRWGLALQERSRLRGRNSRERVKLLAQAKRLFEDSMAMNAENSPVREALLSCISEMNPR